MNFQHLVGDPIIELFQNTPGAISLCEGLAIYSAVQGCDVLEKGHAVDLGSHAGKSSIFASRAISMKTGKKDFFMVDPTFDVSNTEAWSATVQHSSSNAPWSYCHQSAFRDQVAQRIITASNGGVVPQLVGDVSTSYLPKVQGDFSYVFIDSDDHQKELVDWEVNFFMDRVVKGGIVLFHDYGNQYHAPKEAAKFMVKSGKYAYITFPWDAIRAFVGDMEKANNSWHMPGHALPCFVGGVVRC